MVSRSISSTTSYVSVPVGLMRTVRAPRIRGARTVRINPTGTDTYEVVLEIDRETISYLLTTARKTV